jgi:hypothetical protein
MNTHKDSFGYQKDGLCKFPNNTLTIHQQPNINCIHTIHRFKNLSIKFPMVHAHEK